MDLIEASAFVTHVQQAIGNWPGLYGGRYLKELLGASADPVLANCWLWLAQYGPTPVLPPAWTDWTMWQYTDGAVGPDPHAIPGFGQCDRDKFNYCIVDTSQVGSCRGNGNLVARSKAASMVSDLNVTRLTGRERPS